MERLWGVDQGQHGFAPLSANPRWQRHDAASRVRVLADAYGLDEAQRRELAFRHGYEVPRARFRGSQFSRPPTMLTPVIVIGRKQGSRVMDLDDAARLAEALTGVRRTARDGLAEWRYHGRLVARQLDHVHLVIRADFDFRD